MQHVMMPDAGGQLGGGVFGTVNHAGLRANTRLSVRFYMDTAVVTDADTKQERHEPRLHIEFPILGEATKVRRLARDEDKARYADAWRAFSEGLSAPLQGTPLENLPGITQQLVQIAALHGVRTIEQMTDERAAAALGMHGRPLRAQCVAWLEQKAGAADLDRAAALERATAQIEAMQAQMAQMQATLQTKDAVLHEMRAMRPRESSDAMQAEPQAVAASGDPTWDADVRDAFTEGDDIADESLVDARDLDTV